MLADVADNPGCGSPGDGTRILQKLLEMNANNVGFALITDPEVVEQAVRAGVRSTINVELGAKVDPIVGEPLTVTAVVKTITDGRFINKGPMRRGFMNDIGRTVVLAINGIEVIVTERRTQPLDPEIFRRMGIEPMDKQILVVKSSLHYRASYGPMAKEIIEVDAPGLAAMNFEQFKFQRVRRPIFPLDEV
ncbi:MAG: MlrC C-terminal domain-containing protein [bacterium]